MKLVLVIFIASTRAFAQTSISGSSAAMLSENSPTLTDTGYVGSYLTVPAGGATVNFTVNASEGSGTGSGPHLNLVIADTKFGLTVSSNSASDYSTGSVSLAAGTYAIRVERDYANNATSIRAATINSVSVNTVGGSSATFLNTNTDASALAAANTYISNYRQGNVSINLIGAAPNTPVQVHMTRNAFDFGAAVAGTAESASSTSDSFFYSGNTNPNKATYLQKLTSQVPGTFVRNFNTIVPENAGKWGYQESGSTQPATPNMAYVNDILNYAQTNHLKARMHNVIWDSQGQQPAWVNNLVNSAAGGSPSSKTSLGNAITNRIGYYVRNEAQKYAELDGLNEALRTGNYWNIYGATGIAGIYNQIAAAATAAGNPSLHVYTNEYNVLQWSNDPTAATYTSDPYANWYAKKEIGAIRNASGGVSAIGVQYYVDPSANAQQNSPHSPARMMQVMQNLGTQGLPITLTEFGVQGGASEMSSAPGLLEDSMRMMYGTPQADGFMLWGFWQGDIYSGSFASGLYDANWNLTAAGATWQQLISGWSTGQSHLAITGDKST